MYNEIFVIPWCRSEGTNNGEHWSFWNYSKAPQYGFVSEFIMSIAKELRKKIRFVNACSHR